MKPNKSFRFVVAYYLLTVGLPAAGRHDPDIKRLSTAAKQSLAAGCPERAATDCAKALQLDPASQAAQKCLADIKGKRAEVIQASISAQSAGRVAAC